MFYFLGDASKSYNEHFSSELQKVSKETNGAATLGPTIIIFHETLHTDTLASSADHRNGSRSAETVIRDRLSSLSQDVSAFSKIRYFGIRRGNGELDEKVFYSRLRSLITEELKDTTVRSPRSVSLIYKAFQVTVELAENLVERLANSSIAVNLSFLKILGNRLNLGNSAPK